MKKPYLYLLVLGIFTATVRLQSQEQPVENSGALMIRIKAENAALLERQAALLQALEALEIEARQLRIVAKRG